MALLQTTPSQAAAAPPAKNESGSSSSGRTAAWSPSSDGIITNSSTSFPMKKSDEKIMKNAIDEINNVLYGTGKRRRPRLPVFEEICPSF